LEQPRVSGFLPSFSPDRLDIADKDKVLNSLILQVLSSQHYLPKKIDDAFSKGFRLVFEKSGLPQAVHWRRTMKELRRYKQISGDQ
jgi:carboxyl-terminal processing protease